MTNAYALTLTCLIVLLAPATTVVAQNALGDGHALDANNSRTGGRSNNAVSGRFSGLSAAAPRSFGRSFNMTTDAEFRTHNIDNVAERLVSESLYNNPWYWQNIGSLYTEMATGGSGAATSFAAEQQGYYNPFFYDQWESPRGRMAIAAGTKLTGLPSPLDGAPAQTDPGTAGNVLQVPTGGSTFLHDDRLGTMMRSGRDHWRRGSTRRVMGNGMAADRSPIRYTLSNLRGLGRIKQTASPLDIGLTDWDTTRLTDDRLSSRLVDPIGLAWSTRFERLDLSSGKLDAQKVNGSRPGLMRPVMQAVADRYSALRPRAGSTKAALEALDRDYLRIRGAIIQTGHEPLSETLAYAVRQTQAGSVTSQLGGQTPQGTSAGTSTATSEAGPIALEPGTDESLLLTPSEFGLILIHDQKIEALSSGDRSRFDDLVAAGEKALGEGAYLRADRRFTRALRFVPGQPLATAGLINAQVGAGLYLSAALTLKSLLGFEPAMIDVRFSAQLLPQQRDLDRAISLLTKRLSMREDLDRNGLILAWIGHQIDRPIVIEAGLDAMRVSGRDPHFTKLLEQVWQGSDAPSDETPGGVPANPTP
jgi:hypothetical protein